ncbi:MAG: hypothetical protein FJ298_04675 [Planctomycetes bacterium]|nr:hypothetical protein [Planctomycetota bacterium]
MSHSDLLPRAEPARLRRVALRMAAASMLTCAASAQVQFSIDWKSQSVSRPDSSIAPRLITEADVLQPGPNSAGTQLAPRIVLTGDLLSLQGYSNCVGHVGGTACQIDVDALSGGDDGLFRPNQAHRPRVLFSVDEWASGHPATPLNPPHASVRNQGNPTVPPLGPGVFDACADVYGDMNLPSPPLGPNFTPRNNTLVFDGNGLPSANAFYGPGLGLLEPRNTSAPFPYAGDNLDALEIGTDLAIAPRVYFSLDATFLDRLNQVANSGSAAANNFSSADVLKRTVGTPAVVHFATASQLGLDRLGVGTDDLDALVLAENGDGIYQRSSAPYDWVNGSTDMLVFSVRRGSAIINQPDSLFGAPIQPGDLLLPPIAGGLNQNPAIFISAEALGLRTERGDASKDGDDLDAVDFEEELSRDCNENGIDDSFDIATGASQDTNFNGIPDECEDKVVEYCPCPLGSKPTCTNLDANAGCANSTGVGGRLLSNIQTGGSVSLALDDLVLTASQLPLNVQGMVFMGRSSRPPTTFYDGLRCINLPVLRHATKNSLATGSFALGPGIGALSLARFGASGAISPGDTLFFQTWYRDPTGPCGASANVTSAIKVTFLP